MKITSFFILVLTLQMSASVYSQTTNMSVKLKNSTLQELFLHIEKSSNYRFFYSNDEVDVNHRISVDVEEKTVGKILEMAFEGLPYSFKELENNLILIERNGAKPNPIGTEMQQQKSVSGKITDSSGEGLPGVSIVVKGTTNGTISDANGNFSLPNVPENATLQFSFVGMKMQEVVVAGKTTANVAMLEDAIGIEEVVAVGYGTQKKVNLTGAVASINSDEITQAPTSNISNSLAGMLPGLITKNNSGKPGVGSSLSIRGKSTWGNNDLLMVVDGVVRDFQNLDPNEVESISILKDASAGAVYGARAANGVILVTTKRGKVGKPKFSFNGYMGLQTPTFFPRLMNAYEWGQTNNIARLGMGQSPDNPAYVKMFLTDSELADFKSGKTGTDWYARTFKEYALQQHHNFNVNGGSESIKYFMSMGYMNQDGMFDNISFKRYNFRSNVDAKLTKYLNIAVDLDAQTRKNLEPDWGVFDIFRAVVNQKPTYNAYHPDGLPVNTTGEHPIEMVNSKGYNNNENSYLYGTLSFKHDLPFITKGLSVSGSASYNKDYTYNKIFYVPFTMYTENEAGEITGTKILGKGKPKTQLSENFNQGGQTMLNLRLDYSHRFGKHDLGALLLYEQTEYAGNNFNAYRTNFSSNAIDQLFAGGSLEIDNSGSANESGRLGYVGRINYAYADKYLIEASFRIDGSENFPKDKRYGFFPAVSAGWRISEEGFFKNANLSSVNLLKLRGSYGEVGNDRVNAFQFLDFFSYGRGSIFNDVMQPSLNYGKYPNLNITWETAKIADIGLDAGLWDGKLGFEFDYFYKRTSNILRQKLLSIPGTFGRDLPDQNYAIVDNSGIELVVTHRNKIGQFKYGLRGNVSYAENNVIVLDEAANSADYLRRIGRPMDFRTGLLADGLFQSQEEINNWASQYKDNSIKPGDIRYVDMNGDGLVNEYDVSVLSYNSSIPKLMFGLQLTADWKGFDFAALFQGAGQVNFLMEGDSRNMFANGGGSNSYAFMLDYWSESNPNAAFPRAFAGPNLNNGRNSSFWLKDADYVRLKSVEFGYTLPGIQKSGIEKLRVFVSGFNFFTLSKFKYFDPENTTATGFYYPQQKNFNIGINLTF